MSTQFFKTREKIENWLQEMKIENTTINEDLTVDVAGEASIAYESLITIPVQFNYVGGYFDCSNNKLQSLKGCPKIVASTFMCNDNELISLEDAPSIVGGDYNLMHNFVKNLKYTPLHISGYFNCSRNRLESLEHGPVVVKDDFDCSINKLTSLKYCPKYIGGKMDCSFNNINTLEFFPDNVIKNLVDLKENSDLGVFEDIGLFKNLQKESFRIKSVKSLAKQLDKDLTIKSNLHPKVKI